MMPFIAIAIYQKIAAIIQPDMKPKSGLPASYSVKPELPGSAVP